MKEFKNLKRVAQEELEQLDAKYASQSEFTAADAEMYKCLVMALEKHLRMEQIQAEMGEYDEEGEMPGMSGRRGRSSVTGRYVSRDGGNSYAAGYSQGYSEAIGQMSGHYPMYPDRVHW